MLEDALAALAQWAQDWHLAIIRIIGEALRYARGRSR